MKKATVAEQALIKMVAVCDREPGGLSLSNKHQSQNVVSYRVWGEVLRIRDFMALFGLLNVRQTQPLRWYDTEEGRGKAVGADMVFYRNLGCGEGVEVVVEILRSGTIMLRLSTKP